MKKYLFVFLLCLIAMPVWATTYYVDPDTGSNSNVGSLASPWASIPGSVGDGPWTGIVGAGGKIVNGDIIYQKGGTQLNKTVTLDSTCYNGSSAYDSITIISGDQAGTPWGTGKAIIDGQTTRTKVINLSGAGITLDGFELRNSKGSSEGDCIINVTSAATYSKIRRCYIHDAQRTGTDIGHGIETTDNDHMIVEHCTIGPNIGTKGIEPYGSDYGIIRYNIISHTGDHGICLTAKNYDIYGNLFIIAGSSSLDPAFRIKINGVNNDIWNNLFFVTSWSGYSQNMFGTEVGTDGNRPTYVVGQYNRFINNTSDGCGGADWGAYGTGLVNGNPGGSGGPAVAYNTYANNIVMNCNNASTHENQVFWNSSEGTGNTLKYNDIWYSASPKTVIAYGGASSPSEYTVAGFETLVGASKASGNVQLDPLVSGGTKPSSITYATGYPNTSYYALTASSPASVRVTGNAPTMSAGQGYCPSGSGCPDIEGYTTSKFEKDIVGNTRTNWSMGAYEYTTGSTPSVTGCMIQGGPGVTFK